MNSDLVGIIVFIFIAAFFTNFFGLGDVWANRGNWYQVKPEQLSDVMGNLMHLNAFNDSDGLPNRHIKVKTYANLNGTVFYLVKVPHWVFKYEKIKLSEQRKTEMLGLG